MAYITTFEELDEAIKKNPGRPMVLEALWDGDTNGWFLCLDLFTETGKAFWKKEDGIHLGIARFGGDSGVFAGEVPLWPEAVLAKNGGKKLRRNMD